MCRACSRSPAPQCVGTTCKASPRGVSVSAKIAAVGGVGGHHTCGRGTLNGPIGGIAHRLTRQQCSADFLDALRLGHGAVLVPGPFIHSKNAAPIGGRRDDRHRAANRRQPPRQVVCAAQMPRQQRDSKLTALVQYHNGGQRLAAQGARWPAPPIPAAPTKISAITLCKLPAVQSASGHAVCAAAATLPGHAAASRCANASPRAVKAIYAQIMRRSPCGTQW